MVSKRAKYGLRALVDLAQRQGEGPIQIRDISETLNIPRKFLEAILLDLRNEGMLQSRKGKEGGYFMERAPDTITIGKVVRFIDGPLAAVQLFACLSEVPTLGNLDGGFNIFDPDAGQHTNLQDSMVGICFHLRKTHRALVHPLTDVMYRRDAATCGKVVRNCASFSCQMHIIPGCSRMIPIWNHAGELPASATPMLEWSTATVAIVDGYLALDSITDEPSS